MLVKQIHRALTEEEGDALAGTFLDDTSYNLLIQDTCAVYDGDQPLGILLKGVLDENLCAVAYPNIRDAAVLTDNRGMAGGAADPKKVRNPDVVTMVSNKTERGKGTRYHEVKKDGTISNQVRANRVHSGIVGYFDRNPRFPYCRQTAYNIHNPEKFAACIPYFQQVSAIFKQYMPDRWSAQMKYVEDTSADFLIPETAFTTVTVNKNYMCVDEKTECLTRRAGWTNYKDLRVYDEILSYEPSTDSLRWQPVLDKFVGEYNGQLCKLSSRGFESLSTPNHRWPVFGSNGKLKVKLSEEFPKSHFYSIKRTARYNSSKEVYSDSYVKLVAWYMTEGSVSEDKRRVSISQSETHNPHHVSEIRGVLRANKIFKVNEHPEYSGGNYGVRNSQGWWYGESKREDGVVSFRIRGEHTARLVKDCQGKDKVPSAEFLSNLSSRQAALFVETCIKGDGYTEQGRFGQSNKGRLDAFLFACVLAGIAPTWQEQRDTRHPSSFKRSMTHYTAYCGRKSRNINAKSIKQEMVDYEGDVWCPVTPSSFWLARRDGCTFITGNTAVHKDAGDLKEGFGVLTAFSAGKYDGMYFCLPEWKVAFNLRTTDVLLADVHQWHGNTPPFNCLPGRYERISNVFYYREGIKYCGNAAEEMELAKARKKGDKLRDVRPEDVLGDS